MNMTSDTTRKIDLVFAIHNHQPVGNFDFVIEQTYQDSYEPFLACLEKHPRIRIALHFSGHLWEYIAEKHPDFLRRLKVMVERNQVEILGGAYYEAIVCILPERDAFTQLSLYREAMEKFGEKKVHGMWLAERVWEPGLPSIISRSGYGYTFLDEAHFSAAGISEDEIHGFYDSEDRGRRVKIFPIDKTLRYNIPFELPEKTLEELERRRNSGVELITYGDDGEKFGGWPGTKKWVYEDGWLESFFSALEESDKVRMLLPAEAISEHRTRGDLYLPCASYEEMGEWTLPPQTQLKLRKLKKDLEEAGLKERVLTMIRGGFWRQNLAKYPESAGIYRRMLRVSDKVARVERELHPDAQAANRALMRGCANDAYWHGVFGGVYLPHLRHAVQKELIIAETLCDRASRIENETDDCEPGHFALENRSIRCEVIPRLGGGMSAIDVRHAGINLADSMTRQHEAYHERLLEASTNDNEGHASIHDRLEVKEDNLIEKLTVDDHQRLCFIDRFLKPEFSLDDLKCNRDVERGDFSSGIYGVSERKRHIVTLERDGVAGGRELKLRKTFSLDENQTKLRVEYTLEGDFTGIESLLFAPEIHMNLLAPEADDRYFLLNGEPFAGNNLGSQGDYKNRRSISLVDDYLGIRVNLEALPYLRWIWYPVETVSLSEGGIESVYQGSAIHPVWEIGALKGERPTIVLTVNP